MKIHSCQNCRQKFNWKEIADSMGLIKRHKLDIVSKIHKTRPSNK